jgi:hypothetical protein
MTQVDTNPKSNVGRLKAPFATIPKAALAYVGLAHEDGAAKYGPMNWRESPFNISVYVNAIARHLAAFEGGEDCAADSGVPHLAHIAACTLVLLDGMIHGTAIDDRTPGMESDVLAWVHEWRIDAAARKASGDPALASFPVPSRKHPQLIDAAESVPPVEDLQTHLERVSHAVCRARNGGSGISPGRYELRCGRCFDLDWSNADRTRLEFKIDGRTHYYRQSDGQYLGYSDHPFEQIRVTFNSELWIFDRVDSTGDTTRNTTFGDVQ